MKNQFAEVGWVVAGQVATALGTLIGVRILTQVLAPGAYGVVTLATGVSILASNLVVAPLTQAAIHFYPGIAASGSVHELLESLLRCYRRVAPAAAWVALAGGALYVILVHGSPILVVMLALQFACDCWRSANLSLLNAARRQQRFALWTAADIWCRPLAGTLVVLLVGQSPLAVLGAYVVVSICLVAIFSYRLWPVESAPAGIADRSATLDARMWAYALPLIPIGIIAWMSTLGDRYIIGGLLSIADAGIYAALYGLSSSPFLIVSSAAEQALRPIYQTAVTRGDNAQARRIHNIWLAAVVGICSLGVALFALGHDLIASLFVGKSFRGAASLMPWIAAGHAIKATSYVFERVCYAFGQTRRVLVIQLCAVTATILLTPAGVLSLGLRGAAMAVPVFFSVQLATAIYLARRTLREAAGGTSVGTVMAVTNH
jgi:O-antigen/teichoic acid export membrane protein